MSIELTPDTTWNGVRFPKRAVIQSIEFREADESMVLFIHTKKQVERNPHLKNIPENLAELRIVNTKGFPEVEGWMKDARGYNIILVVYSDKMIVRYMDPDDEPFDFYAAKESEARNE